MLGELGADRVLVAEQQEVEVVAALPRRRAAPATITAGPESPPIASIAIRGPLPTDAVSRAVQPACLTPRS